MYPFTMGIELYRDVFHDYLLNRHCDTCCQFHVFSSVKSGQF